jgi:type VI secretion system FHA domain protein
MTLTLSVLRCPDEVPPEMREIRGGEFSIGRGPDNDWTLLDPDKFLSKRHCMIAFRSGGWQIADLSTNGTFHNRDPDPVGQGQTRDLRDGDRLRLGNYEIEVHIVAEAQAAWTTPAAPGRTASFADPFGDDPFAPPKSGSGNSFSAAAFGNDPLLGAGGRDPSSMALPADFDPLGSDFDMPLSAPTQSDHASALDAAFRTPTPIPARDGDFSGVNLDDWDLDIPATPAAAPPPAFAAPPAPVVAPDPFEPPAAVPDPFVAAPIAPPMPAPIVAPMAAPAPAPASFAPAADDDAEDPFAEADVPSAQFVAPAPPPEPVAAPVADLSDFDDEPFAAPVAAPVPVPPPVFAAPPPAPVAAPPAAPPPSAPPASAPHADLMAAFLRGAGMEDAKPADPIQAMQNLGAAFRALVGGLRQALIARAAVKGEFRIEQTMIRARGNNPLKFSAGDDDALAALIGAGRRSDMSPAEAIGDALRDMRLHELATVAAMQSAVRALLERFDPAPLRAEGEKTGGMLPGAKRARAFELYEKLHGEIARAMADDFDSVFGKAFARAYEQALTEVGERERR